MTATHGHHHGLLGLRCRPTSLPNPLDGTRWRAAVFADHPRMVFGHVPVAGEARVAGAVSTEARLLAHSVASGSPV